jgi:MFS family permease
VFQALRIPDFRLLWSGGLISSLGSWLLVLAVPAHILAATGSLRDTGLTLAAAYLPQLVLGPVAGAVADGWDRRRLMIAANLLCAGAVSVMLLGTSPGRYWVLYAALIAESSGTVIYTPALQARIPAIVGTGPLLSSANSLTSVSSGIVRLIGGPVGVVLLAVCGIRWLICADTFSYLLSAAAVFMTSRSGDGHRQRNGEFSDVPRALVEGARALRAQPVARALLPVSIIFLAANASLSAVLIPFGVQRLGGSEHTGLLLSCLGAGFLLGAPVIRAFLDRTQPRNLLTASLTPPPERTSCSSPHHRSPPRCPPRQPSACAAPCRWSSSRPPCSGSSPTRPSVASAPSSSPARQQPPSSAPSPGPSSPRQRTLRQRPPQPASSPSAQPHWHSSPSRGCPRSSPMFVVRAGGSGNPVLGGTS